MIYPLRECVICPADATVLDDQSNEEVPETHIFFNKIRGYVKNILTLWASPFTVRCIQKLRSDGFFEAKITQQPEPFQVEKFRNRNAAVCV
jgi:hypothetical protein